MINDYATLQSEVITMLARSDMAAIVPTCIQLCEGRLNRDLIVRQRITTVTGTSVGGLVTLPTDYYRLTSLTYPYGGYNVPVNPMSGDLNTGVGTYPGGYTVTGAGLKLFGNTDKAYNLTYVAKIPTLSDAAPTNWLLTQDPSVYFYGTLIATAPYLKEDERLVTWGTLYEAAVKQFMVNDEYARYGNAPAMRIPHAV